jgi:hypothetical protein
MWYGGTVNDIKAVVQWLEGEDDEQWRDQTDLAADAMADAAKMAAPLRRPDKGTGQIRPAERLRCAYHRSTDSSDHH